MQNMLAETVYKPRRPHRKSRGGCLRCKQGRRKCDEAKPGCTRCTKRNLHCEYSKAGCKHSPTKEQEWESSFGSSTCQHYASAITILDCSEAPFRSVPSLTADLLMEGSSCVPDEGLHAELRPVVVQHAKILDLTEQHLFNHYLSHTVYAIAFDEEDLYALQTGIPGLASHSKSLTSSIIALAAICRCYDILMGPGFQLYSVDEIEELSCIADKHHKASLRQTQADIAHTVHYNMVLANAPLMVLYACASHCVHIELAKRIETSQKLGMTLASGQSQWVSLIRAAHLAYAGLLSAEPSEVNTRDRVHRDLPILNLQSLSFRYGISNNVKVSKEDGPSKHTRALLLPIVVSTSGRAFARLRIWVRNPYSAAGLTLPSPPAKCGSESGRRRATNYMNELQPCFQALNVLEEVMGDALNAKDLSTSTSARPIPDADLVPQGLLSEVSPWLRKYLASVTSAGNSRQPLRRTIMSFLNRVPIEYLDLVQTTLNLFVEYDEPDNGGTVVSRLPEQDDVHRIAIGIFAHWLVLVMLLDGVWWIGSIGVWELSRIVTFMRHGSSSGSLVIDADWWPESMLTISQEIRKQNVI